jgi:hypothetical protein
MAASVTFTGSLTTRLPLAEAAAALAADLVTGITDETVAAIRAVLRSAIAEGGSPAVIARLLRDVVGLSTRQAQAVAAFRTGLLDAGLAPDRVDAKVDRYATRLRSQRARTIARTETLRCLNAGQHAGWLQARDAGLLPATARRRWMATSGAGTKAKLCEWCAGLDGQLAPLDGLFAGGVQAPPRHPGCRCTVVLVP